MERKITKSMKAELDSRAEKERSEAIAKWLLRRLDRFGHVNVPMRTFLGNNANEKAKVAMDLADCDIIEIETRGKESFVSLKAGIQEPKPCSPNARKD